MKKIFLFLFFISMFMTLNINAWANTSGYFEVSDLEDLKDFIAGDGFAEQSKGNVWFNKNGYDGNNTLLIAEKNELTENSYKSLLSIIEVMFNSKEVVNYFSDNYPAISSNKEFTGFKIEINPEKTSFEESLIPNDSGYKFLRITIDKNEVNNIDFENPKVEDNIQNNDSNSETVENPKTGLEMPIIILVSSFVINVGLMLFLKNKNTLKKI